MSGGEGGGQKSGSYIYSIGVFATANKEWIHSYFYQKPSSHFVTFCDSTLSLLYTPDLKNII